MAYTSPLHDVHVRLGAKVTGFGGWDMPLAYEGVIAEHLAVRKQVGLFDVTHLGKILVSGLDASDLLDRALPGKVAELADWTAGYNLVLDSNGGIIDDVFVYRTPDNFLIIPNAANFDSVMSFLAGKILEHETQVDLEDARMRWAILALSGPQSREVVGRITPELANMKMHTFSESASDGLRLLVARTGYTGEVTFEYFVDWALAPELWERLFRAGESFGIKPAGLGARDTLRLEMGYPLHGHDIDTTTNPIEAGLGWLIQWDKAFDSKRLLEALRSEGPRRKLVGLIAESRRFPRQHAEISRDGEKVGEVTSGNFSPILEQGIALGYVDVASSEVGTELIVDVRGKELPMHVKKPPFKP
jgi:aminomethyltransferase